MGRRGRGTRGRARRREGVTDSYSMHNNWGRLSTCVAPSISPRLSHLRPMETHTNTHTHIFTKTQKVSDKLLHNLTIKAMKKKKKKITPWCLKIQLIWRRSHWQTRLKWTKPLPFSGTFSKGTLCWHAHLQSTICLPCSHTIYSNTHAHTLWPLQRNSQTILLAGRLSGIMKCMSNPVLLSQPY